MKTIVDYSVTVNLRSITIASIEGVLEPDLQYLWDGGCYSYWKYEAGKLFEYTPYDVETSDCVHTEYESKDVTALYPNAIEIIKAEMPEIMKEIIKRRTATKINSMINAELLITEDNDLAIRFLKRWEIFRACNKTKTVHSKTYPINVIRVDFNNTQLVNVSTGEVREIDFNAIAYISLKSKRLASQKLWNEITALCHFDGAETSISIVRKWAKDNKLM